MHNNRVDKSCKHEGVGNVGFELAPLGNSSSNDGGGGGSEGKLEEPADQITSAVDVGEDEVGIANEGQLVGIRSSVGKGITDGPESNSSSAGI